MRLYIDYRAFNKLIIKNRHPLPLIDETIDRLAGAKIYTKLDLRDAYHRIKIKLGDEWKTAFRTRYGHYEYIIMPFGLTNAPATFQAYINEVLDGYLDAFYVAYMDDICIYSDSLGEHEEHVRKVLNRLRKYGLYAKLSKCEFYKTEIQFWGFNMGIAGVSMNQAKVQVILEQPIPQNFRDIQIFMGFANFYRRFIKNFSKITRPITDLLKRMMKGRKVGPFDWNVEAQSTFDELKACFTQIPILRMYDLSKPLRVEMDASGFAIGAILSQLFVDEKSMRNIQHPIAFWSRRIIRAERNYKTHNRELLTIIAAFYEWRHYLKGVHHRVEIFRDHNNFKRFMTVKQFNRRQAR